MNSRERILAAVNREKLDRIPTDIWMTGEVFAKLESHYGSIQAAYSELRIDSIAGLAPAYIGPDFPEPPAGEFYGFFGYWGIRERAVNYGTGVYHEQSYYPFAQAAAITDLDAASWPNADWFDYKSLAEQAKSARETHAVSCGYMVPFYMHNLLRGLEQSLVDPYDDTEFTHYFLGKVCDFLYQYHLRIFETCDGLIDIAQVSDDYGSQTGPMISLATFREFYKPHLQRFIDLCHGFGIKVFHHDDGAIRDFIPDLVEMGIDILNPVQHNCPGMDMRSLKSEFGDRICFHGAVENQKVLPFGTPEEVRAEVRDCIDALAEDGTGYILAPCHNIQPVTSIDNIIAMYDEAYNYGRII